MTTIDDKRRHVARAKQTRMHTCHWRGCTEQVPPAKWGCVRHWFRLPKRLRDAIWLAYEPGQEERGDPSDAYLKMAAEVDRWIAEQEERSIAHGGEK